MRGRKVCYYHGGKAGAPRGERNGMHSHGYYTAEAIADRKALRGLIKDAAALIEAITADKA
jgi:hypothetical protein